MVTSFHNILNPAPCQCEYGHRLAKIRDLPFLETASQTTRDVFSAVLVQQCLQQGDELSPYENQGGSFGIVVSGAAKIYRYVDDDRYVIFDLLAAGDFFIYGPERGSGVDMYIYPDQIASLTTSCILTMSKERFQRLLSQDPGFGFAIVSSLAKRLTQSHDRQVQCLALEAEQRVAFMLKHLLKKNVRPNSNPGLIPFNLSRKDLASMTGLSLETVSRTLSDFERRGIISTGRAWVQISNPPALSGLVAVATG